MKNIECYFNVINKFVGMYIFLLIALLRKFVKLVPTTIFVIWNSEEKRKKMEIMSMCSTHIFLKSLYSDNVLVILLYFSIFVNFLFVFNRCSLLAVFQIVTTSNWHDLMNSVS